VAKDYMRLLKEHLEKAENTGKKLTDEFLK